MDILFLQNPVLFDIYIKKKKRKHNSWQVFLGLQFKLQHIYEQNVRGIDVFKIQEATIYKHKMQEAIFFNEFFNS